jgi:hypothetical protein
MLMDLHPEGLLKIISRFTQQNAGVGFRFSMHLLIALNQVSGAGLISQRGHVALVETDHNTARECTKA